MARSAAACRYCCTRQYSRHWAFTFFAARRLKRLSLRCCGCWRNKGSTMASRRPIVISAPLAVESARACFASSWGSLVRSRPRSIVTCRTGVCVDRADTAPAADTVASALRTAELHSPAIAQSDLAPLRCKASRPGRGSAEVLRRLKFPRYKSLQLLRLRERLTLTLRGVFGGVGKADVARRNCGSAT